MFRCIDRLSLAHRLEDIIQAVLATDPITFPIIPCELFFEVFDRIFVGFSGYIVGTVSVSMLRIALCDLYSPATCRRMPRGDVSLPYQCHLNWQTS